MMTRRMFFIEIELQLIWPFVQRGQAWACRRAHILIARQHAMLGL